MSYDFLFTKANNLYLAGALNEAEQIYRQILDTAPQNPDVLNMLGLVAQAKNIHSEAVNFFYKAISSAPNHLPLYFNLAVSLDAINRPREALEAYQKVLSLDKNIKEAYNNIGGLYEKLKQPQEAIESYVQALKIDSNYVDAAVNLAVLQQDFSQLAKLYSKYPQSALPAYYLALHEFHNNNFTQANDYITRAVEQDNETYDISLLQGMVLLALNHTEKAAEAFRRALRQNPVGIEAMINLANIEHNEDLYRKALDLAPNNPEAHLNLADLLYAQKRTSEALEEYRQAVILRPDTPQISNNLALILKDLCDYMQAIDLLFNAYIKAPEMKEISMNLAETLTLLYREKPEEAKKIAKQWYDIAKDNPFAAHTLAAFNGEKSPLYNLYSEEFFDGFANRYEQTMSDLKYNIINKVKELNLDLSGLILDLGCGTGLAAEALRTPDNEFIGVDISANMLKIATEKKVYKELIHADINDYLQKSRLKFNFILALDVFDYIENISDIFVNTQQTPIIFTIEKSAAEVTEYQLTPSGRYQHNPDYIRRLLSDNGYDDIYTQELILREENSIPVTGVLFVAGK